MTKKIGYLGPVGSYSQLAAQKFCGDCERVPYKNFNYLLQALLNGEVEFIVMPIENSLNGGVMQNIDLLQSTEGVVAIEECYVKIDHRLIMQKGANLSDIKRVYSHQQALGQCAKYLAKNLPDAVQTATLSTAASIEMVKTKTDAGIVGSHCDVGNLYMSPYTISDEQTNYTQFLLVKRGVLNGDVHSKKIYFSVTCKHEAGALVKLLAVLADYKLNMTRIGSRPIKESRGEYRFFIELEGDYSSDIVKNALKDINAKANSFKLLGVY
jgi:prephenate dehydratase